MNNIDKHFRCIFFGSSILTSFLVIVEAIYNLACNDNSTPIWWVFAALFIAGSFYLVAASYEELLHNLKNDTSDE